MSANVFRDWFPFDLEAFERKAHALPDDLKMKYIRLLWHMGRAGGRLPNDPEYLAGLIGLPKAKGWRKKLDQILFDCRLNGDSVEQARVIEEIEKAREIKDKRRGARKEEKSRSGPNVAPIQDSTEQRQEKENPHRESSSPPRGAAPAGPKRHAVALIAEFDASIVATWGEADARPWPAATDCVTAERLLEFSPFGPDETVELARPVFDAIHARLKGGGRRPPTTLSYHERAVREAIAERDRVLPQETTNGGNRTAHTGLATGTVRRRAGLAAAAQRRMAAGGAGTA